MKAHELTRGEIVFKKFRLKNGKVLWNNAHMHGDRRRVCFTRKVGSEIRKMYVKPHSEVEIVK